ncbi:MAG: S41 family peptidase [Muribaculaceae bacterium]|nr:S41 family peptidase [Muribaculaceae bacterium]
MRKLPVILAGISAAAMMAGAVTRSPKNDISRNLDIFTAVYKNLQTSYVDSIDVDKSINTAIAAMLDEIDPYTEYIPESEQADFMTISTGEYGGIGSYIGTRDGKTFVSEPRPNSPAIRAGLIPGDVFITIDGDTVTSMSSDVISKKLRGQAGTKVNVTVRRPYGSRELSDTTLSFEITREKIDVDPVPYYGVVRDDIGYIQLTTFNEKSFQAVKDALLNLKSDPRVKSIVLDLRNNGGGLLESAVQIVGLFVPKGTEVLRTRGKGQVNERVYKTTAKPVDTEIPLAILVNGSSASSSEIVTGAIQDLDRGIIVGERSFGKGLVQSTRPIPYNGLMKVTVAKYYIPSGRLIQAIDYSHRNPDGTVARIPDSLTTVWHTRAGREVRDGGGITPDVKVTYPEGNRLVYNIVRDGWSFDFANRYAAAHPVGVPAEDFEVTDTIFSEFKRFIDPDKFKYDRACEMVLDQLEKSAETEGYLNDTVKARINALRDLLRHDLNHDLDLNRKLIETYLGPEMVMRWHGTRGSIIQTLKTDRDVDSAAVVLHDPARYRSILSVKSK